MFLQHFIQIIELNMLYVFKQQEEDEEEEQNENSNLSSDGEAQWENDSSSRFSVQIIPIIT